MAKDTWGLRHPRESVVSAVLALTQGTADAAPSISLTLKQASALLTHLRTALALALSDDAVKPGRCAICSAVLSVERALLAETVKALRHVRDCGACGEDSWAACGSGGQHAESTLAAIESALRKRNAAGAQE